MESQNRSYVSWRASLALDPGSPFHGGSRGRDAMSAQAVTLQPTSWKDFHNRFRPIKHATRARTEKAEAGGEIPEAKQS